MNDNIIKPHNHPGIFTGPWRGTYGSRCLLAARCKTRLIKRLTLSKHRSSPSRKMSALRPKGAQQQTGAWISSVLKQIALMLVKFAKGNLAGSSRPYSTLVAALLLAYLAYQVSPHLFV